MTAERLFAQRGINGVSLREIGVAAGQRNNSASQYHFGSKAGLIDAIFALRMGAINQRRLQALADLDHDGDGNDLRGLIEAFISPLAESLDDTEDERWYVRFLANVLAEPGSAAMRAEHREFTAGLDEVMHRLGDVLADLPDLVRQERLLAVSTLVVNVLAGLEGSPPVGSDDLPIPVLVAGLVDMTVGLLTAPVSTTTYQKLGALDPRTS